jgi:hypothetical protein
VVYFCIGKQKVVWILKLRENGWEAAVSALSLIFMRHLQLMTEIVHSSKFCLNLMKCHINTSKKTNTCPFN